MFSFINLNNACNVYVLIFGYTLYACVLLWLVSVTSIVVVNIDGQSYGLGLIPNVQIMFVAVIEIPVLTSEFGPI